jgi:hypothetical protein
MPVIDFSSDDILASKVVEPAYYEVDITEALQKPAKDGKSQNYLLEGRIVVNSDTGDTTFANVPLGKAGNWIFNSKMKGNLIPLFEAVGADITPGSRFEFFHMKGKRISVYVENTEWNGQIQNKPTRYRASVTQPPTKE